MKKTIVITILVIICATSDLAANQKLSNIDRENGLIYNCRNIRNSWRIVEMLKEIPKAYFNYLEWEYDIENEKVNISDDHVWVKQNASDDSVYLSANILDNETLILSLFNSNNTQQDGCLECNIISSKIVILKKTGTEWKSINKEVLPNEFSEFIYKVFERPVIEKKGFTFLYNEVYDSHAPFAYVRDKKLNVRDISILDNSYGTVIEMEWLNGKFEIKSKKKLPLKPNTEKITNDEFREFLDGFRLIKLPESFCVSKYYLNEDIKTIPEKFNHLVDIEKLSEYKGIYIPVKIQNVTRLEYIGVIKVSEVYVAVIFRTAEANNYPNRKNLVLATYRPDGTFINSVILVRGGDENIESSIDKMLKITQRMHSPGEGSTDYGYRTYRIEKDGTIKMLSNRKETRNW